MIKRQIYVCAILFLSILFYSVTGNAETVTWTTYAPGSGVWYGRQDSLTSDVFLISNENEPFNFSGYDYQRMESIIGIKLYYNVNEYHAYYVFEPVFFGASWNRLYLDGIDTALTLGNNGENGAVCFGYYVSSDVSTSILEQLKDDGMLSAAIFNNKLEIYSDGYMSFSGLQRLEITGVLSPVPIPSAALLMGTGFLSIIGLRLKYLNGLHLTLKRSGDCRES
jgi:hypothetical protein